MPKTQPPYPPEFRLRMIELARSGRSPGELSRSFGPSSQAIRNWIAQADRDEGRREGDEGMARKHFSTEQIIGMLREAEVRVSPGQTIGLQRQRVHALQPDIAHVIQNFSSRK